MKHFPPLRQLVGRHDVQEFEAVIHLGQQNRLA